ncbi:ubiquitin-like-specific protease ULP1B [Acrasis kona]|uniref:Ubiquitin-like-specific protease ULP1B n=1 Tax=Acrasis kona TaxID=1008807 RepID=A0AAW2ZDJ3_9EUKA
MASFIKIAGPPQRGRLQHDRQPLGSDVSLVEDRNLHKLNRSIDIVDTSDYIQQPTTYVSDLQSQYEPKQTFVNLQDNYEPTQNTQYSADSNSYTYYNQSPLRTVSENVVEPEEIKFTSKTPDTPVDEKLDPFEEWMQRGVTYISELPEQYPLTANEEAYVSELFSSDDVQDTELVADIGGINVTKGNLRTLRRREWVDDAVINAYFTLLYKRSVQTGTKCYFFAPSAPFFYQLLTTPSYDYESVRDFTKNTKMLHMNKIIIPVNISGAHWTLCILNLQLQKFEYYDTLIEFPGHREAGEKIVNNLRRYLEDEVREKNNQTIDCNTWPTYFYDKLIPHQDNGYDCGVFICQFARVISQDKPIEFDQTDMQYFRRKMVCDIVERRV